MSMSFHPLRWFLHPLLAASLTLGAAAPPATPVPVDAEEWAALQARDESETLGELQAGRERPSILVPLMVVGFLSVVVWSVAGDDERERITFETLDTGGED